MPLQRGQLMCVVSLNAGPQSLARQLEQAEARQSAELDAGAIHFDRIAQHVFDGALIGLRLHVDEIDDDEPADVAQAQLARDFLGSFEVGVARGRFDVAAARAARRVDVDRDQRFGVIDDQAAARGQGDLVRIGRFDLALDLVAREQRHRILVQLQLALRVRRHEALHVFLGLLEGLRLIDQALADIIREVVAQAARDRVAFLENQERRGPAVVGRDDRVPGGLEIVQIPLQFFGRAADAGGAHDGAHAVGNLQAVHRFAHLIAIFAFDAARYAAGARIVRHEHQEASGEADEGGERGALVAALLLLDLHDELLAFLQQVLDVEPAAGARAASGSTPWRLPSAAGSRGAARHIRRTPLRDSALRG